MSQLFHGRIGREPALCDGCGKRIEPQTMIIQRTDGTLFCSAECARENTDALDGQTIA